MKKIINAAVVVCVSIALIYGCDSTNNPVSVNEPDVNRSVSSTTTGDDNTADILSYTVEFKGKVPVIKDENVVKSIFNYTVTYKGSGPSSNNFFLEVPDCAGVLQASIPANSTQYPYVDPTSGLTGILWNSSLSRHTSEFSVIFNGDVSIGMVTASVASGNRADSKEIAGPCKGLIEISGTAFIDSGGDDPSGIGNIPVSLKDTDDNIISTVWTNVLGWYSFEVVPGTYTLSVPESLAGGTITYAGTPFVAKEFNVDSKDNDFRFYADPDAMIEHLKNQTILTNTQDTKFWIKVVRTAAIPNSGNTEVPIDDVYKFLKKIGKQEYISGIDPSVFPTPPPFQFTGDGQADAKKALDILAPPNPNLSPEQLFDKELLAAMLNIVSGRGVKEFKFDGCGTEDEDFCSAFNEFHLALLAYGIDVFQNPTVNQKLSTSTTISSLSTETAVFSTFNRSGTGGLN